MMKSKKPIACSVSLTMLWALLLCALAARAGESKATVPDAGAELPSQSSKLGETNRADQLPGAERASRKAKPELTIVEPKDGQIFNDTPFVVKVQVENFMLRPPQFYFGKPDPDSVGHLHYYLDDLPEVATDSTVLMFGKKAANHYLSKGPHTIAVELVHDNHENLNPRIWKRVNFYFTYPENDQQGVDLPASTPKAH